MLGWIKKLLHSKYSVLRSQKGFTLLELVIFTAIFSMTIIAFISVLVSITRTQVRQTAVTEVNQQSQFLLQAVQFYVERSSFINIAADVATTSVNLVMTADAETPTLIFASGTQIFSKVGSDPAQVLTSNRVSVTDFSMTKHSNPGGKDTLSVSFTIAYNTLNPQQNFIQTLSSAVARVNAATFDSDINPDTNGTRNVGSSNYFWSTVNGIIKFNTSNSNAIGIGIAPPSSGLTGIQVHDGDVYIDNASNGLVLRGDSTHCYRITVDAAGNIATSSATCY